MAVASAVKALAFSVAASPALADGRCCYNGCGSKPIGCNQPGEYCNSADHCGGCGGTWCSDGPAPTPAPTPSPGPPTPAPPIPAGLTLYCPTASDMNFEYGNIHWANDGWEITGDARISSKTSFNLLGGYIEFDMDTTKAHAGVNTNIYTVSMQGDNCGKDCYCDIQDNGSPVCMELDITENNGNCKFASTWHTTPWMSGGRCDTGGCAYDGDLPGGPFHMKSTWAEDGNWLTYLNGKPLHPNNYEKDVSARDKEIVKDTMNSRGAAIESSQWVGWVPGQGCPGGGDLGSSSFSISNLRILGKVHHGPEPTRCAPAPTSAPTSTPTMAPTPAPTGPLPTPSPTSPTPPTHGCPGGSVAACLQLCPGDIKAYKACAKECDIRCGQEIVI